MKKITKGQALVETALIAPLLIFFLIGLFEVGWVLRGYYILVSSTREAARHAARPHYLTDPIQTYSHFLDSLSEQIPFEENNGRMLISVWSVENEPCGDVYTVTHKVDWSYPVSMTTRVNTPTLISDMKVTQHNISCLEPLVRPNTTVIVEVWYDQPQLFGFPLVSNPLTDPVKLYDKSVFRVAENVRQ